MKMIKHFCKAFRYTAGFDKRELCGVFLGFR